MAVSTIARNRLVQTDAIYSSEKGGFISKNGLLPSGQLTLVARNISNGSLYVLWHEGNTTTGKFVVGKVISGSQPTDGQAVVLQYHV